MSLLYRSLALSICLASLSTGCALIIHGKRQPVNVTSSPAGAEVMVDGVSRGTCPTRLNLDRKSSHTVRIQLEGYQPIEMKLERKMSGWIWGNVLFGGLVGVCIDVSTGSMYRLTPEQLNATLATKEAAVGRTAEGGLIIATTLTPDPRWERCGVLTR